MPPTSLFNFPALPGDDFHIRTFRGEQDIPAIVAVHDACRERDRTDPHSVCYRVPNLSPAAHLKALQHAEPSCNLFVERAGSVVAYGQMSVWGVEDRLYLWRVWIVPRCRRLGLGTALLLWGERRARELHGTDPRPALHLANASDGESDTVALLKRHGYHLSFVSPELAFDRFETPTIRLRSTESASGRLNESLTGPWPARCAKQISTRPRPNHDSPAIV